MLLLLRKSVRPCRCSRAPTPWGLARPRSAASGMVRSTVESWLQECPYCGYVAWDISYGDDKARHFTSTPQFSSASLDPSPIRPPAAFWSGRRSKPISAIADRRSSIRSTPPGPPTTTASGRSETDCGSRPPDISPAPASIRSTRGCGCSTCSGAHRVGRRGSLVAELAAEELGYPFAEIVSLHRDKIAARDDGRYRIDQALKGKTEPPPVIEDPELIRAPARHIKIIPNPRRT